MLFLCVQPIFLNEVMLRKSPDDDPDGTIFHLSHIEHLYSLRAPSTAERFVVCFNNTVCSCYQGGAACALNVHVLTQ